VLGGIIADVLGVNAKSTPHHVFFAERPRNAEILPVAKSI
jgi:hypothetical protein